MRYCTKISFHKKKKIIIPDRDITTPGLKKKMPAFTARCIHLFISIRVKIMKLMCRNMDL